MSFNWPVRNGTARAPLQDSRAMIRETNAFLNWAMQHPDQVPTIPRRRVDQGGYHYILKQPGARAAVEYWWGKAIDTIIKAAD
jgi:hypothetical protein